MSSPPRVFPRALSPSRGYSGSPIVRLDPINEEIYSGLGDRISTDRSRPPLLERLNSIREAHYLDRIEEKESKIELLNRELHQMSADYKEDVKQLVLEKENIRISSENTHQTEMQAVVARLQAVVNSSAINMSAHDADIRRLLDEMQNLRTKLALKEAQYFQLADSAKNSIGRYEGGLQALISENNVLKNQLLQIELQRNHDVKQAEAQGSLERSRRHGVVEFCKQNTAFVEKQIHSLSEQLLDKNIAIQALNREVLREKKRYDQNVRQQQEVLTQVQRIHQEEITQMKAAMITFERRTEAEAAENKRIQVRLTEVIATLESNAQNLQRKIKYCEQQIKLKEEAITSLKTSISHMEEDHAKEMNRAMMDSRIKRKSVNNLSSSMSSLEKFEDAQGSSIIKSGRLQRMSSSSGEDSSRLPTVREELAQSRVEGGEEDENLLLKDLVLHYETMIEELRRNHVVEIDSFNTQLDELKEKLNAKQQQLLEVLSKFSPLLEDKMNEQPSDEDHRNHRRKYQKASLNLLEILLKKNGIAGLRT